MWLLATLVEQHHDERGIALTAATASFGAHLVVLGHAGDRLVGIATDLYAQCASAGIEILWDDRDVRAGEQLADADLIGAAVRVTLKGILRGLENRHRHHSMYRKLRPGMRVGPPFDEHGEVQHPIHPR